MTPDDNATSIALQGDKIIVGGYTIILMVIMTLPLPAILLMAVLDSSFGVNGKVTTDFNNSNDDCKFNSATGRQDHSGGYS